MNRQSYSPLIPVYEKAFYEVWNKRIRALADDVVGVIMRESKAQKIDPRYILYVLYEQPDSWSSIVGDKWLGIDCALELYTAWGQTAPDWDVYVIPPAEQEQNVDGIIQAVGNWADSVFRANVKQVYIESLRATLPDLQEALTERTGEPYTRQEAAGWACTRIRDWLKSQRVRSYMHNLLYWKLIEKLVYNNGSKACPIG